MKKSCPVILSREDGEGSQDAQPKILERQEKAWLIQREVV